MDTGRYTFINNSNQKYKNIEQSWIDHSDFLTSRPRYAGLFSIPTTDYKAWAKGLKAAGYATNPQYANMLIKIIEEEELYKFDRSIKRRGTPPTITAEEFAQSVATQDHPSNTNYRNREEMRNGIICIETMPGDSFEKIAGYYGIKLKKLLQYNDKSSSTLDPGQLVFLKKKKSKAARGYEFHRVKAGDTMYSISQQYGVRLKNLCRFNYLSADSPLTEGIHGTFEEKEFFFTKYPVRFIRRTEFYCCSLCLLPFRTGSQSQSAIEQCDPAALHRRSIYRSSEIPGRIAG